MKDFIQSAVLMPTALSFFGNFKTEKSGENKDKFNIKLTGWAPLIMTVRMAALSNGIYETNTLKRIRLLREMNVIKSDMEGDLIETYLVLVKFRIMNQINNKVDDGKGTNYLRPDMLGREEQEKLRKAMKVVEALQKYIEEMLLFGQPI
jgi:CBS domain-containing protein